MNSLYHQTNSCLSRKFLEASTNSFTLIKNVVITPNPTRELEWTVISFDKLIGAEIYMFRWGKAPSSGFFYYSDQDTSKDLSSLEIDNACCGCV